MIPRLKWALLPAGKISDRHVRTSMVRAVSEPRDGPPGAIRGGSQGK